MGWVLFSFHLQRSYSLVVSNERATLYLVRFPPCAPPVADPAHGGTPERVGRCRIPPTRNPAHIQKISKRDTKRAATVVFDRYSDITRIKVDGYTKVTARETKPNTTQEVEGTWTRD